MKALLLVISFLIISVITTAQIPDYFNNNPEWRTSEYTFLNPNTPCVESYNYVYYLGGTITITDSLGTKTYRYLNRRGTGEITGGEPYCNDAFWLINQNYALIRQVDRKIFIKKGNNPEMILYDFDLNVGDTIQDTYIDVGDDNIIFNIDSVLVNESGDSYYLKRFHFNSWIGDNYYIEGIGHRWGFVDRIVPPTYGFTHLYCYSLNGYIVYIFPGEEVNCDYLISIIEVISPQLEFTISPNPASQSVRITVDDDIHIKWLRVYSITGEQMLQESLGQSPYQLNISGLQKGLYLLEIESVDGFHKVKRLIIE